MARSGLYGQGYMKYARILDDWAAQGNLDGLDVTSV